MYRILHRSPVVRFFQLLMGLYLAATAVPGQAATEIFSGEDNVLFFREAFVDQDALSSINGLVMSPEGSHLYTISPFSHTLSQFARDGQSGDLKLQRSYRHGQQGVLGLKFPRSLLVTPDGAHVLVSAYEESGPMLSVFQRDALSGDLIIVQELSLCCSVNGIALSPEGEYIYLASSLATGLGYDNFVEIFARDAYTGQIFSLASIQISQITTAPIGALAMSPDGAHLYAQPGLVMEREAATGLLRDLEKATGFSGQVPLFSPDGANLYVADGPNDAFHVYARDPESGYLTLLESFHQDQDGLQGLAGVCALAISPDGSQLYAAGCEADSIVHFLRSSTSGRLQFHESVVNGMGAVQGIRNPVGLAVSGQGENIYVAGRGDDALVSFGVVAMQVQIFLPVIVR